jgi:hypothetical protein
MYPSSGRGKTHALLCSLQALLVCSSSLGCFIKDVLTQRGGNCVFTLGGEGGVRMKADTTLNNINNIYLKHMSHLKKMGLHHNIQWHPLVLCIGLSIAKNSTHNSLFEPLPHPSPTQIANPHHQYGEKNVERAPSVWRSPCCCVCQPHCWVESYP